MSIKLTAAQERVVLSTGHVLVDAGAGSGKTTTVVQLLLHALGVPVQGAQGELAGAAAPLRLDQVAAITFTNASAADLVRKMREALRKAGRAQLATDVDAARLGTIHGFCGELLRSYALRAQLPPAQRVLTDVDAAAVAAEAARDAVHAALQSKAVVGLDSLLADRKLSDVMAWVAALAQDVDRLERWAAQPDPGLREHERALLALVADAVARRQARLLADAALDFDRMLVAARDLLRLDDVRHAVQRRLRLLVVDEFQDVDPVQQEIAMLLGGLERADPSPTRLVLVGDPKQSIYRFRRADVTLWDRTARRFTDGAGSVLPLHENFRSKAAILGFVDHVIGALMDRPLDAARGRQGFEVNFAPLDAKAEHADGDGCVELYILPPAEKGAPRTANAVRSEELPAIASRLWAMHTDDHTGWGQMAVLVPSWNAADRVAEALATAGIPAYVPRGEGFWDAREVLDCLLLLRAARDPSDDIALYGLLKSPFIGVRDDTLLALARRRTDGVPLHVVAAAVAASDALSAGERTLLARAQALVERGARLRDRRAPAAWLDDTLRETGYLAALALDPSGAQRVANVRKLLRLLEAERDQSLGEFLREVREAREREDKEATERLFGEKGDVVTVTTVHSAKGLEWDVVVLADLAAQLQDRHAPMLAARAGLVVKDDSGDDDEDPRYAALKAQESAEEMAQRLRVWYVAATRAKHRMLLFTLPLGKAKSLQSAAAHLLAEIGELEEGTLWPYRNRRGQEFVARVHLPPAAREREHSAVREVPALTLPPQPLRADVGSSRLSATQLMTFAKDPAEWRRIYVDRVPATAGDEARERSGAIQRAIVTGQIVHAVLERLDESGAEVEALLEEAIGEWDALAPSAATAAGAALRAQLRARVATVAQSEAWRSLATVAGTRHELAFTQLLGDGTALVGAFDLAASVGEGVELLDVKSSTADAATLRARYAVQAAVYVGAVRALTGRDDVAFALLSAVDGQRTPVPVSVDVTALVAALRGS